MFRSCGTFANSCWKRIEIFWRVSASLDRLIYLYFIIGILFFSDSQDCWSDKGASGYDNLYNDMKVSLLKTHQQYFSPTHCLKVSHFSRH